MNKREDGLAGTAGDTQFAVEPAVDFRVGPLMPLDEILREAGLDPQAMLERCALPPRTLDDPLRRLDFQQGARLLGECADTLDCPELGLRIGQRFEFASLGLLAPLMQCSPTVGAALHSLQRYFHVHDRGGVPYVTTRGTHEAAIGYSLFSQAIPGLGMIFDMSMAVAFRMLSGLCGPQWKANEVLLAHRRPVDIAPYRRLFRAPLHFDASHTEIRFDAEWLAQPVVGADAAIEAAARHAAEMATDAGDRRMTRRALAATQALVMSGQISGHRVAGALAVPERTMRRALRAEGTSLKAIIAEVRCQVAEQLLGETRLLIGDIAVALKYRHAAAFSRAFRTWTNTTPGRWRAGPDCASGDHGAP